MPACLSNRRTNKDTGTSRNCFLMTVSKDTRHSRRPSDFPSSSLRDGNQPTRNKKTRTTRRQQITRTKWPSPRQGTNNNAKGYNKDKTCYGCGTKGHCLHNCRSITHAETETNIQPQQGVNMRYCGWTQQRRQSLVNVLVDDDNDTALSGGLTSFDQFKRYKAFLKERKE